MVELLIGRCRSVRLARRQQGGHDIPEAVIRRRFEKGWENFEQRYKLLVDSWRLYDNSSEQLIFLDESESND